MLLLVWSSCSEVGRILCFTEQCLTAASVCGQQVPPTSDLERTERNSEEGILAAQLEVNQPSWENNHPGILNLYCVDCPSRLARSIVKRNVQISSEEITFLLQ
jgi:hypothetical protein